MKPRFCPASSDEYELMIGAASGRARILTVELARRRVTYGEQAVSPVHRTAEEQRLRTGTRNRRVRSTSRGNVFRVESVWFERRCFMFDRSSGVFMT